jgi:hypothetical protein
MRSEKSEPMGRINVDGYSLVQTFGGLPTGAQVNFIDAEPKPPERVTKEAEHTYRVASPISHVVPLKFSSSHAWLGWIYLWQPIYLFHSERSSEALHLSCNPY